MKAKLNPEMKRKLTYRILKAELLPVVKRAAWMTKDACRNSCGPGDHFAECLADKAEDARALKRLKELR